MARLVPGIAGTAGALIVLVAVLMTLNAVGCFGFLSALPILCPGASAKAPP
jgi:hypothetical protein